MASPLRFEADVNEKQQTQASAVHDNVETSENQQVYMVPRSCTFLDLPRELRDKCYKYNFLKRLDATSQAEYDHYESGNVNVSAFARRIKIRQLAYQESLAIGEPATLAAVKQVREFALVNKAVHEEASQCFYKENTFTINIRYEETSSMVQIRRLLKHEVSVPSKIDFGRIERLMVTISSVGVPDNMDAGVRKAPIEKEVMTVVRALKMCGNKLKMLHVNYFGGFNSDLEEARHIFDHPTTGHPRTVLLRVPAAAEGALQFDRSAVDPLFADSYVLDSLKQLKGCVQDFVLEGDLRLHYIYEITNAILRHPLHPDAIIRRRKEAEAEKIRQETHDDSILYAPKDYKFNPISSALAYAVGGIDPNCHVSPSVREMRKEQQQAELERLGLRVPGQ